MKPVKKFEKNIISHAQERGIDPYTQPFKANELGLKATDYGSFSDWCKYGTTLSAKHNIRACLKVAEHRNGRPYRYLLLPTGEWEKRRKKS
jgi:hypothetical protein